jgi:hypothetical protein
MLLFTDSYYRIMNSKIITLSTVALAAIASLFALGPTLGNLQALALS